MVLSLFVCCFVAVIARSFYLQVIRHEHFTRLVEQQQQRTIPITPARGCIFDRNGAQMAVSIEMDSRYADPKRVKNPSRTAEAVAEVTMLPVKELHKKLTANRRFVWLARQLPPETSANVKALKLPGIGFVKESKRFYPNFEMAAHVLGFTGMDPVGLEGIERSYDKIILGKTGYLMTERDALGRDVSNINTVLREAEPGKNLFLTLDKNLQYFAENELAKAVTDSGAKGGMALVMDPWTGKILAMANYPTFNPNSFRQYPTLHLRNRCVTDSFEPGSTFKIFLLSAALEEKLVRPGDSINCEDGRYSFSGRIIRDDHPQSRISVAEVLKYSSNIGSAKIGVKLGEERLYRYLKLFGFGEKSGIDLPGEVSGGLRPTSRWYGTDIATISFGQGGSATALQLATATSAVANGGLLMKPYLVERATDSSGKELQRFEPVTIRRVISAQTAASMTRMMEEVTKKGGTGTNAALDGVRTAGKTGTAQKVDPKSRIYSAKKRTASFVGFVPSDKPRLTILVVIDEPATSPYGGVVAAPAFREIAFKSLCYLNVSGISKSCKLPKSQAVQTRPADKLPVNTEAEGGSIEVAGAGTLMPDFRGMSMRSVLQLMEKRQLNLQLRGSGQVVEQYPQPGQVIQGTDEIWVRLAPSV